MTSLAYSQAMLPATNAAIMPHLSYNGSKISTAAVTAAVAAAVNANHIASQTQQLPLTAVATSMVSAAGNVMPHTVSTGNQPLPPCDDKEGHYIVTPNENLTPRYKIMRLLGQGTFGKVAHCWDRQTRQYCAIKIIRAVQKYRDASRIEIRVLRELQRWDPKNQNRCIHMRECFDYRNHICMVFDLYSQSVFDFMKSNHFAPFPAEHIQQLARQLLTSVAFLHRIDLVHTDLKPENILLVDSTAHPYTTRSGKERRLLMDTEIRLIDFGSATFEKEYHSAVVSTRHYRAPEIIIGCGWSFPCDIWSVGCILVEFFTGEALFQTHDNLEHLAMMDAL
ncbi:kinase-like domain-containing protein [Syncephalis fuscata]|nr:kinase-like domain-containing protein [Syncephalis fuscata]